MILTAIIAGENDPERLADCTNGRLKASRTDIATAVLGRVTSHHRLLLQLHLPQIDALSHCRSGNHRDITIESTKMKPP